METAGPAPGINITGYSDAWEVLNSQAFAPHHPEWHQMLGGSLLLLDGEDHFRRRRQETELFTTPALRYYESKALAPVIDRTIGYCLGSARPGERVRADLVTLVLDMLYGLGAAILGIDGVDTPERAASFKNLFVKMSDGATITHLARDHAKVLQEALDARREFVESFYNSSLDRRKTLVSRLRSGDLDRHDLPRDLLTNLLLNDAFDDDPQIPLREMLLYMIASIRTTLHALPHVVAHLHEWLGSRPQDQAKLSDAEFLRRAVIEAIRLHSALPSVVRRAKQAVALRSGIRVEAGQIVSVLLDQANVDPVFFGTDASDFDPYREVGSTGPTGRGRVAAWGLSFGSGAHVCIGRRLAVGDQASRDDDATSVHGTTVAILQSLYAHAMTPDPDLQPRMESSSFYDAYESFPVVLTVSSSHTTEIG